MNLPKGYLKFSILLGFLIGVITSILLVNFMVIPMGESFLFILTILMLSSAIVGVITAFKFQRIRHVFGPLLVVSVIQSISEVIGIFLSTSQLANSINRGAFLFSLIVGFPIIVTLFILPNSVFAVVAFVLTKSFTKNKEVKSK